jgi:hypothetical protein
LLNVITIIDDNEFHVVEGFYESVASNAETVLRVLGELAQAACIGLLHRSSTR